MKIVGLITEYNPFHNGHIYHIQQTKLIHQPDVLIVIMSGNHVQRGEPAIIDKWQRSKLAIDHGVDLVIELPLVYAVQSADYFGDGAVKLLYNIGVTDIVFGSESGNVDRLYQIANGVYNNKEQYHQLVSNYMSEGKRYVEACNNALSDLLDEKVELPNDILGYSYVKSVVFNNYNINMHCIKRTNDFHGHDIQLISSATAIRKALKENNDIHHTLPNSCLYKNELGYVDDYFKLLQYKLFTTSSNELEKIHLVEEGIENLLLKHISSCNSYEKFVSKLTSKRYTASRIQRMLLHILLNNTKDDINKAVDIDYIRVLAMNTNGKNYLNKIKKDLDYTLVTTFSKHKHIALDIELKASKLYELIYQNDIYKKEYSNKPYIKDCSIK